MDLERQLIAAAGDNDLLALKAALSAGADVHADQDRALRLASEKGHLEIVKCLLEAGANAHARRAHALQSAAKNGHQPVVDCLLKTGAAANANKDIVLPLLARNNHPEAVSQLLAVCADLQSIIENLHTRSSAVQVAALTAGDVLGLSVIALAAQGVCPEALCALLERQGHKELATMLSTTHMLDTLTPEARAEMLGEMLPTQPQPEIVNLAP